VPRQRGDGDAAAVVRNRERTTRVERLAILFFFFFFFFFFFLKNFFFFFFFFVWVKKRGFKILIIQKQF